MRARVALTLAAAGLVLVAAPAAADPAPAPLAPPATSLTLLTGDVVVSQGPGSARVLPAASSGIAADLQTVHTGARTYVLPGAARPYLGRYLDPGLFDVTTLAGAPSASRLAVRITLRPGAIPHLPGVTLTSRTATSATGYLTARSARDFGAALAAQWTRDAAAGWPADSALFDGVVSIGPARAAPPPAAPAFPQVTLTVKVLDEQGRAAPHGLVSLIDTDDARRYEGFVVVDKGEARVSVPLGHYSALAQVDGYDASTGRVHALLVPLADAVVTGAGQTLVLDGRRATTRPSVTTPRPGRVDQLSLTWDRADRSGHGGVADGSGFGSDSDVRVAPTGPARHGAMHWLQQWILSGGSGRQAYTYDLAYSADRVPADQSHTVTQGQLAAVPSRYYGSRTAREGAAGRLAVLPYQRFSFGVLLPLPVPGERTEYVLASPQVLWSAALIDDITGPGTFVTDGLRRLTPGPTDTAEWLRPALLPGVPVPTAVGGAFCATCRSGDLMTLALAGVTDSTPAHGGGLPGSADGSPVTRLQVFAGGRRLVDLPDTTGVRLPVPSEATAYRLVLDVDRAAVGATTSTASHTELTFRSARGSGPLVPDSWFCLGPYPHSCRALPVLQVRAPLPVDLTGTLPQGRSGVDIAVTHVPGAVATGITGVTVETRVGGGAWRPAATTRTSEGRYRAVLDDPAAVAGLAVDLRITAQDADGSTISQTTDRAYVVAGG